MDTPEQPTVRQMDAINYLENTKHVSLKTNINRRGNKYSIIVKGRAKNVPEIEKTILSPEGLAAFVVYHDLDSFTITNPKTGKKLDLVSITPPEWKQKSIKLISPKTKSPEVLSAFSKFQMVDVDKQECIVSGTSGIDNPKEVDISAISCLWNTLIARFMSEIGDPVLNEEGRIGMRKSVLQRRQEVLDALNGISNEDPWKVATRSFIISNI